MKLKPAEILLHPLRLRILATLGKDGPLTTAEIGKALHDEPISSLYRHLHILREAGYIRVTTTRVIRGQEEKTYALTHPAFHLSDEALA